MKCFREQSKCENTSECPVNDNAIADCALGPCYSLWNNSSGKVTIKGQGCSIGTQDCASRTECLSEKRKGSQDDYFCCCSTDFCNWIIFNRPRMKSYHAKINEEVTTEPPSITSSTTRSNMIPIIPVLLPLLGIVLCLTIVAYLWQRHYFHEKMMMQECLIQPHKPEHQSLFPRCLMGSCVNINNDNSPDHDVKPVQKDIGWFETSTIVNTEKLKMLSLKGRGKCGTVWKAMLQQKIVAVKVFAASEKQSFETEMRFYHLPNVNRHTNLLRFIGTNQPYIQQNPGDMYIVLEYHDKGSLKDYLTENEVEWLQVLQISEGVSAGLAFLHEAVPGDEVSAIKPPIAHRDLKTNNILLKKDLTPCIADFGLAHIFVEYDNVHVTEQFCQVGTLRYMAPEILDRATNMDTQAFINMDMYAFGLILWELLSRCSLYGAPVEKYRSPFFQEVGRYPTMESMYDVVCKRKLRPAMNPEWMKYPNVRLFCETITECWDHDPDARISAGCVEQRLIQIQHCIDRDSLMNGENCMDKTCTVEICPHYIEAKHNEPKQYNISLDISQSACSVSIVSSENGMAVTDIEHSSVKLNENDTFGIETDHNNNESSVVDQNYIAPIKMIAHDVGNSGIEEHSNDNTGINDANSIEYDPNTVRSEIDSANISADCSHSDLASSELEHRLSNAEIKQIITRNHVTLSPIIEDDSLNSTQDFDEIEENDIQEPTEIDYSRTNIPEEEEMCLKQLYTYSEFDDNTFLQNSTRRPVSVLQCYHDLPTVAHVNYDSFLNGSRCLSTTSSGYGSVACSDHLDTSNDGTTATKHSISESENTDILDDCEEFKWQIFQQFDEPEAFKTVVPVQNYSTSLPRQNKWKSTMFPFPPLSCSSDSCLQSLDYKNSKAAVCNMSSSKTIAAEAESKSRSAPKKEDSVSSLESYQEEMVNSKDITARRSSLDYSVQMRRPSLNTNYGSCKSVSSAYLSCNEII